MVETFPGKHAMKLALVMGKVLNANWLGSANTRSLWDQRYAGNVPSWIT